jgi:hypothetical protein
VPQKGELVGDGNMECLDCGKFCNKEKVMNIRISDLILSKVFNQGSDILCFACLDRRLKKLGKLQNQLPVWSCDMEDKQNI